MACGGTAHVSPKFSNAALHIRPNPASGVVFIRGIWRAVLYDVAGRRLGNIAGPLVGLSRYPNGVYFIRANGLTGKITLKK